MEDDIKNQCGANAIIGSIFFKAIIILFRFPIILLQKTTLVTAQIQIYWIMKCHPVYTFWNWFTPTNICIPIVLKKYQQKKNVPVIFTLFVLCTLSTDSFYYVMGI